MKIPFTRQAFLIVLLGTMPATAQDQSFKVIVNSGVSVTSLSAKEISQVFLKKTTNWPSGLKITAVNLGVDHPTREAFSQAIHGKGAHPIERRWESLIFAGMGVPPMKLETESDVVSFISSNAGAIGYVAATASLPAEVRELEIQ